MHNLKQCKSIFIRELMSYFNSPIAYIFIVVFVMMTGGLFMTNFFLIGNADMRYFFDLLPIILCIFIPAVTMRIWAEEKKGNTFELLLTFPMDTYKLVLGKFAASFIFYLITLAATLFIPMMLIFVGKPDIGPIIGGYLGSLLIGGFFLSVGIFISGLCIDQIIAFIVSMMACFFFYLSGLDFMASLVDGWFPGVGSFLKMNFGMTRHFSGFEKGVIDNRDILYFIVMTGAFLALNIFSIEDRMRPKAKVIFSGAVGVCLAMSMVLNFLISDIPLGRFDLTEGKLYTITDSTKNILRSLKAPVTVKLYISASEKMPTALKTLEQDVKDQLEELKILGKGKLNYKVFHMEVAQDTSQEQKEETLEDKLQQKGISPFQVQSIEEDEVGIKLIYSALSIAYKEKEEKIIPRIVPQSLNSLEYDLMSKIFRMTLEKRPTVALVAPYTEKSIDPRMLAMLQQFGQAPSKQYRDDKFGILDALLIYENYDLKRIRLTEDDPLTDGIDSLVIVAPENLNERQRYEINRFLYEGGNVIVAAQGYEYDYSPTRRGVSIIPRKNNLGLNQLIENYGVKISDDLLMDEKQEVLSISGGRSFGPFAMSTPVKAPMHVTVDQESMNQDVSITGRLSSLFYLWGSALELDKDKILKNNLKQTTLFSSSKQSWQASYRPGPLSRNDLEHYGDYKGNQPLAILLEGQFPNSYFGNSLPQWPQDGNPADNQEAKDSQPSPTLHAEHGKLLIVGCSKMFEEDLIQSGGAVNFFINSVDALTLSDELINIRSRQPINRAVKTLSKGEKLWNRFMTIVLIPIIVIILGAMRAILRRKEKDQYIAHLKLA